MLVECDKIIFLFKLPTLQRYGNNIDNTGTGTHHQNKRTIIKLSRYLGTYPTLPSIVFILNPEDFYILDLEFIQQDV